ncbi:hypothetical protein P280DRAFT_461941 [Massarina eburnea CBS 473.64]|uniref:Rhodopsin domain-containing protein n=1 Tax=Massarina eburnea CBS 473.64 TaxID=1395130 RepID=A0A6A6RLI4_9PLEO|nr:hypothetical protein P280DRAFT_461941 [Massarina eburnea CBS 473.64]
MSKFVTEMWAWYALTMTIIGARFLSRRLLFKSFKALQVDDWLMLFIAAVYTVLLVIIHIQTYTPTNLINPADNITLTPEDIKIREFGSKLVLVTEHLQMVVIWCCKGCLLLLYSRLTMSLRHNIVVKMVTGYVIGGFIVMEILWFVWCRPFHYYWKVPAPNLQCSTEVNHMITNAVFNISSDLMIIALPMPVLFASQLPLKRKITLACVFALGSFIILAAILSKYYSLSQPYGTQWIYWYMREVSTAIITANLPLTWTLLQRIFGMSSFFSRSSRSSRGRSGDAVGGARVWSTYGNLTSRTRDTTMASKARDPHAIELSLSESQEEIYGSNGMPLKIWHRREVSMMSEEVDIKVSCPSSPNLEKPDEKDAISFVTPTSSVDVERHRDTKMGVSTQISRGM